MTILLVNKPSLRWVAGLSWFRLD